MIAPQTKAAAPRLAPPPRLAWVHRPFSNLTRSPEPSSELESQLLLGEEVTMLGQAGDYAEVINHRDGERGFVARTALQTGPPRLAPPASSGRRREADSTAPDSTAYWYRVIVPWAPCHRAPEVKAAPQACNALPLAARLRAYDREGDFLETSQGWLWRRHLAREEAAPPAWTPGARLYLPGDAWVTQAEALCATPYLWGGRSPMGLDCSALVQLAAQAQGHPCPRNSGAQAQALSLAERPSLENLRRGDLLFFTGHVVIMCSSNHLLHASGFHVRVVCEPLAELRARFAAQGVEFQDARRPSSCPSDSEGL